VTHDSESDICAAAFLAATRASEGERGDDPDADTLIRLSSNEIRRLYSKLILIGQTTVSYVLNWWTGVDADKRKPEPPTTANDSNYSKVMKSGCSTDM